MSPDFTGYKDLAEALRCCARYGDCPAWCPRHKGNMRGCITRLKTDAALAIDELYELVRIHNAEGVGA